MANVNAPFGLRAVRRLDGAAMSFQYGARQIAYNNAHNIYTGDLVISLNTGYIDYYTNGGTTVAGVFSGCTYNDPSNNGQVIWRPAWLAVSGLASTDVVTGYLTHDPMLAYEIQSGSAGAPLADIMDNSDVVVGTGSTRTGQSGAYLDSTHDTTATLPVKIIGLGRGVGTGYDATSGYNIVEVILNTLDIKTVLGI